MRVFHLFLLLTFLCPRLWAQTVDEPISTDSTGIQGDFMEEDNTIDSAETEEVNESVNEAPVDSMVDSMSQEITLTRDDSVTRSSWYEMTDSTDSLSIQDTVVRERGSPDSVRARYSTPLMPDLQSCLLYTSPSPRDKTVSRMPSSA